MVKPNPPSQPNGKFTSGGGSLTHTSPDEGLLMNKWHLIRVIARLQSRSKGPRLEHAIIPLALFLGLILALLPADFQNYLGIKAELWEAIALILTVLSGVATAAMFIWWTIDIVKNPPKTPEDCYEEIIEEMAQDRKRLAEIEATPPQAPDKEGSPT